MTLRIRNWERYQHYKDRCPPWVKLHFSILSSRDWVMWDDASRVLAIACILLASRTGGEIPNDPEYLRRVAYLNKKPNIKPLIDCGFLTSDDLLADASTLQANDTTETEKSREETEKSRRTKKFTPPTLDEVRAHVAEKGYTFDPETFHAYYESQGWKKANGRSVESWRGCCVTFQKRETPRKPQPGTAPTVHPYHSDDVAKYAQPGREHERWFEYMDAHEGAETWPRFEEWMG